MASRLLVRWATPALAAGLLAAAGCRGSHAGAAPEETLELLPSDRVLVIAPHPDDEVLGCGGLLQEAVRMGLPVRIVFLTSGDNNEWSFLFYRKHPVLEPSAVHAMGEVRMKEAVEAARRLGVDAKDLVFLGYPDFGTLSIWYRHWGDRPAYRHPLTHAAAVPYPNALRPGAPHKGEEIVRDLRTVIADFRPTRLFVAHPADHNPDHRAAYLFTTVALWDLKPDWDLRVYPYLVHFARWPRLRGDHPGAALVPPALGNAGATWITFPLTPDEVEGKQDALEAHRSQVVYRAKYLESFVRRNELFGTLPPIVLGIGTSAVVQLTSEDEAFEAEEPPEELEPAEKEQFVGVNWHSLRRAGDDLVLTIDTTRPLLETVSASMFVFGYRTDRPFAEMPKLRVRIGALGQAVYDQDRRLDESDISITRRTRQVIVRVPLRALGNPSRVLTGASSVLGELPLNRTACRVVELRTPPAP